MHKMHVQHRQTHFQCGLCTYDLHVLQNAVHHVRIQKTPGVLHTKHLLQGHTNIEKLVYNLHELLLLILLVLLLVLMY